MTSTIDPELDVVRLVVDYRSEYTAIPAVRNKLRAFLEQLDVNAEDETGFGLLLALTECVGNVIRHAHARDGRPARVVFEYDGACIRLLVYDTSPEYSITAGLEQKAPDVSAERGRGLFLMQSLTDNICYERTVAPAGKLTILTKRMVA